MKPDDIAAGAGVAAVLISLFALTLASRSYKSQRLALIGETRNQWESISTDWALLVLYYYGDPDFYYSDATVEERQNVRKLIERINSRTLGTTAEVSYMRQETRRVRRVARFFAHVAESIFRGHMTVTDAYMVFGPDIARHRDVMLWVSGRTQVRPAFAFEEMTDSVENWQTLVDQMVESNFHDNQNMIVALADLMTSEQSRRGDTYAHLILGRAHEWTTGGGRAARKNVRKLARGRWKLFRALRLSWQLQYAERVRWDAVVSADPNPIYLPGDEGVIRAFPGMAWLVRKRFRQAVKAAKETEAAADVQRRKAIREASQARSAQPSE